MLRPVSRSAVSKSWVDTPVMVRRNAQFLRWAPPAKRAIPRRLIRIALVTFSSVIPFTRLYRSSMDLHVHLIVLDTWP